MDAVFLLLKPLFDLAGALYGAAGSFLRECAWLYKTLQTNSTKNKKKIEKKHLKLKGREITLLLALLPVWILCGAIIGGILGLTLQEKPYLLLFAGALWRPIITNTRGMVRILAKTLAEDDDQDGDDQDSEQIPAGNPEGNI